MRLTFSKSKSGKQILVSTRGCIVSTGWHIKNCKPNMILKCAVFESTLRAKEKAQNGLFAFLGGQPALALAA